MFQYRWRSISALGTGGFVLLYWRLRLTGAPSPFASADNPTSRDPSLLTRFYTFTYLPVFNFFLLIYPFQLSFDWSMDSIPRITTIFDIRNLYSLVFYAVISKVTWKALTNELIKQQEKREKYLKKNSKTKQKWNYNYRIYNRRQDSERKSIIPHKENASSKRTICPCNGCKHMLTDEHTSTCRTVNNNNNTTMMHHSTCVCPASHGKAKAQSTQKYVHRSPQVAMILFTSFMILPFVPASNILFYVGFVVAERVLYLPSVGFCFLLGLGAGSLTKNLRRYEMRSRIFMLFLLTTLLAMSAATLRRNLDWRDEESLFKSALHVNPPKGRSTVLMKPSFTILFVQLANAYGFIRLSYLNLKFYNYDDDIAVLRLSFF